MSIPFDPKELQIVRRQPSFNPALPGTALFDFPVTEREAYVSTVLNKQLVWQPYGVETSFISPHIIPDNIARGFVIEAERWPTPYTKAPDMFGINWVYVPVAGGAMEDPDYPHPLEDVNDWKEIIKFPDIYSWDWEGSGKMNYEYLKNNGKCNVFWFLNGMGFERLISFMGFEGAALAMIDEEQQDALKELYDKLADMYINMIQHYIDQLGVQEVLFHDDWGSQRSPFFSLDTCREMLVPALRKIADWCHSKGLIFQQHSCGKNELLVPAMIDAHVDLWCGQPMNDKYMLVQKYGDKIMLGVETPNLAPDASESEIDEAAHAFVEKYDGKRIMASNRMAPPAFNKAMYKYSRIALGG